MFNTPLGKKLYENVMSLGYHVMTGKAALYSNVASMVEDFIENNDGNIYLSKKISMCDLEKLILYINDYTDYRFDMKISSDTKRDEIMDILNKYNIKYDIFESNKLLASSLNESKNKFGFFSDKHYDKNTVVINTGMKDKSVLHIDMIIK